MASADFTLRSIQTKDDPAFVPVRDGQLHNGASKVYIVVRRGAEKIGSLVCKEKVITGSDAGARAQRELRVWWKASQNASFIARLINASFHPGTGVGRAYMEHFVGGDLDSFLLPVLTNRGRVHPLLVFQLSCQVTMGLMELQAKNILHRNIRTDNVLLNAPLTLDMNASLWDLHKTGVAENGQLFESVRHVLTAKRLVVLAGFGLSRDENDSARDKETLVTGAYQWPRGTSAPELVDENWQSFMGDVYSLGVLIHTMCTLEYPSARKDNKTLMALNRKLYSPDMHDLVFECVKPNPVSRPSAGDVMKRLWDISGEAKDDFCRALDTCYQREHQAFEQERTRYEHHEHRWLQYRADYHAWLQEQQHQRLHGRFHTRGSREREEAIRRQQFSEQRYEQAKLTWRQQQEDYQRALASFQSFDAKYRAAEQCFKGLLRTHLDLTAKIRQDARNSDRAAGDQRESQRREYNKRNQRKEEYLNRHSRRGVDPRQYDAAAGQREPQAGAPGPSARSVSPDEVRAPRRSSSTRRTLPPGAYSYVTAPPTATGRRNSQASDYHGGHDARAGYYRDAH